MTKLTCQTCKEVCYTASPRYANYCPYCGAPFYIEVGSQRNVDKGLSYIYTLIRRLRKIQPKCQEN